MFIRSQLLAEYGFDGIFSDRHGGVSEAPFDTLNLADNIGDQAQHVASNLQRLCEAATLPLPHRAVQVHGADVLFCSGVGTQHDAAADALMAQSPRTAVAVRTADCVPVLLADPDSGMVAAVHAGWRGTAAAIVQHCHRMMCQRGACGSSILASIGPSIGACCFAIRQDAYDALAASVPEGNTEGVLFLTPHPHADLAAINQRQLQACGVTTIEMLNTCTCCHPERFFSHRRDQGATGRHLAIISAR